MWQKPEFWLLVLIVLIVLVNAMSGSVPGGMFRG
jgi:hypothetical protein